MDAKTLQRLYPDADSEVLEHCLERIGNLTRGELYAQSRQQGNDDRWAAMFSLRRAPACETDATFSAGKHFSEIYGEPYAAEVRKQLKARGVSVTSSTDYEPGLAEFCGDPRAVLDGRQTLKKRSELLKVAANPLADPFEKPRLSDRAVADCAQQFALQHPEEARKMDAVEMKAEMVKRHAMGGRK